MRRQICWTLLHQIFDQVTDCLGACTNISRHSLTQGHSVAALRRWKFWHHWTFERPSFRLPCTGMRVFLLQVILYEMVQILPLTLTQMLTVTVPLTWRLRLHQDSNGVADTLWAISVSPVSIHNFANA